MSDENETRGIQVHTGSRIGYAHPSLSRDEVERLDRLRDEAGDRASAELVERALFEGDAEALAALGFHAVEVESGPSTLTPKPPTHEALSSVSVAPIDPIQEAAVLAYWRERSAENDLAAAVARAERAEAQLAALHAAVAGVRCALGGAPVSMSEIVHAEEWDALDAVYVDVGRAAEAYTRRVRAEALREVVGVVEARITSERITAERARDDERILAQHAAMGRADMCEDLAARFRARADEIERSR